MDRVSEFLRLREIGCGRFAPQHIGIRRVSQPARHRHINAAAELIEAFRRAFAVNVFPVARVRVGK